MRGLFSIPLRTSWTVSKNDQAEGLELRFQHREQKRRKGGKEGERALRKYNLYFYLFANRDIKKSGFQHLCILCTHGVFGVQGIPNIFAKIIDYKQAA